MKIIGVAIKHGDMVIGLPKPMRHHNVIRYMINTLGLNAPVGHDCPNGQGFYLEDGTYLDREQAREFVLKGKTLASGEMYGALVYNSEPLLEKTDHCRDLFSEDLW